MAPVPWPSSSKVWIHMPCAWKPSTSACWQSARIRVEAELGAGVADDRAGGLGEPHLLGERLPLQRGDHRAAGLLGVRLEHARAAPVRGAGRRRAGRWRASRAARPSVVVERRDQQVERVPGVGVVDRLDVGDPAPGLAGASGRAARGGRTGAGPSRRPSRSRPAGWSMRRTAALELDRGPRRCPATAITSSLPSVARTTLIAATPKPTSSVTPSAISWRASRKARRTSIGRTGGRVRTASPRSWAPRLLAPPLGGAMLRESRPSPGRLATPGPPNHARAGAGP